jgi:tRNA(Ile)-lysidine synthetase-like protein
MITIDFKIFYKITLLKLDTDVDNLFNNLKVKMKENKNYSAFIFFDKLKLRNWKKGDYFLPYGLKGKKQKLKKFFIDRKFRRFEKERTMVFEDSEGICFVWCYQNSIKRGREFIREFKKKSRMYLAQLEVI